MEEGGEIASCGERAIDGKAFAEACAYLGCGACARVEGEFVGAKEEDRGVCVEGVLGAVAVVDIPVYNENVFEIVFLLSVAGSDGNVVEEAEAHGGGWGGVVAWWAHADEGVVPIAAHNAVEGLRACACGEQSGEVGLGAHAGVAAVQSDEVAEAGFFDVAAVCGGVDGVYPLHFGWLGQYPIELVTEGRAFDGLYDCGETLRAFRVVGASVVQLAIGVMEEGGGQGGRKGMQF